MPDDDDGCGGGGGGIGNDGDDDDDDHDDDDDEDDGDSESDGDDGKGCSWPAASEPCNALWGADLLETTERAATTHASPSLCPSSPRCEPALTSSIVGAAG